MRRWSKNGTTFIDNSDEILSEFDDKAKRAMNDIGQRIVDHAKAIVPVQTGRLKNSIDYSLESDTLSVGSDVEYAATVELGGPRRRAQPYIRPAVEDHTEEYKQVMENYMIESRRV